MENRKILNEAAQDYRYLLNRGYTKKSSLKLVGDHHRLNSAERNLLFRMVHSDDELSRRLNKKVDTDEILDKIISIDGYNLLIAVETLLRGEKLLFCDDGFVRDIYGSLYKFKTTDITEKSLELILKTLKKFQPKLVHFFFDKPISNSGKLAAYVQEQMRACGVPGDAQAVKLPDTTVIKGGDIVISSDGIIIEKSAKIFDLISYLAKNLNLEFFRLEK